MATKDEVQKLSALARIQVPEEELDRFAVEFDAIMGYIGQLERIEFPENAEEKPGLFNVLRADGEAHPAGLHTEALAAQFPAREGDALSVKQVITHG